MNGTAYRAYWLTGNREYPHVLLAKVPLEKVDGSVPPAMRPGDYSKAPAILFKTYGRDSLWVTSPRDFLLAPAVQQLDRTKATLVLAYLEGASSHQEVVGFEPASAAAIQRLIAEPEGTIPISRLVSPTSAREALEFLRSISQLIVDGEDR